MTPPKLSFETAVGNNLGTGIARSSSSEVSHLSPRIDFDRLDLRGSGDCSIHNGNSQLVLGSEKKERPTEPVFVPGALRLQTNSSYFCPECVIRAMMSRRLSLTVDPKNVSRSV